MIVSKMRVAKGALLAVLVAGGLTAMSIPANAEIVCNRWNECWRTNVHRDYPPTLGIIIRDDDWARRHHRNYHWRHDRDDQGYWRNGRWHSF